MQIALTNALAATRPHPETFAGAAIVLDFTRATAQWNGATGPLSARLTCGRDAAAFATDNTEALHSFAPNTLRCTSRGLLVEETRTNFVPQSFTPAPTTIPLAAGIYTVSMLGSGSVAASGASLGTVTPALPLTFTLAAPGSVTLTPSAGVSFMQLENGAFATSPIATGATPVTRDLDRISFSNTAWLDPQSCTILVEWEQVAPASGVQTLLRWQNASYSRIRSGNLAVAQANDASGTLILNASAPGGPPMPGTHRLITALAPNDMEVAWSGSLANGTPGSVTDTSGTPAPMVGGLYIGSTLTGEGLNGWIRKLAFWPQRLAQPNLLTLIS